MNQTCKNEPSTKAKWTPLETCDTSQLHGKKVRDIYTTMYDVRKTMFLDQTGQFPTRLQSGNKYIMVLVEIDSNAILVEPMKGRKDAKMIRVYNALLLWLKKAGIIPKKHVLDDKVLENMKNHIRQDEHGISPTRVPQAKRGRSSYSQLQITLPQHISRSSRWLPPNSLGPSVTANRDHTQSHLAIECNADSFSIWENVWLLFARHWALRMQKERAPMDW